MRKKKKKTSDFLKNQKIALSNMNAIYITSESQSFDVFPNDIASYVF